MVELKEEVEYASAKADGYTMVNFSKIDEDKKDYKEGAINKKDGPIVLKDGEDQSLCSTQQQDVEHKQVLKIKINNNFVFKIVKISIIALFLYALLFNRHKFLVSSLGVVYKFNKITGVGYIANKGKWVKIDE